MSRPSAVHGPFRGAFAVHVFENHPIKRRLNISNPLKISPLQRGDPDVCHDPLLGPAVYGPFRGAFALHVFENHPIKGRLIISILLKI